MAYLPGVPNMGPAPVSSAPAGAKVTVGKPHGVAAVAHSVGKPGRTQHMGNLAHGGAPSSITGGDPMAHILGHYGKNAPPLLGGAQNAGGVDPTAHAGSKVIRGGAGGIRPHVKQGGLGPGRLGAPGPSNQNYSMNPDPDSE